MRACNVHANQDVNVCVLRLGMIREPYAPCTGNGKGLGVSNLSRSFGERSEHHLILYRTQEAKRKHSNHHAESVQRTSPDSYVALATRAGQRDKHASKNTCNKDMGETA